jgi:hypothetical protein
MVLTARVSILIKLIHEGFKRNMLYQPRTGQLIQIFLQGTTSELFSRKGIACLECWQAFSAFPSNKRSAQTEINVQD